MIIAEAKFSANRRPSPIKAGEQMARVLLAGNDWKFRALLRAQLIEEVVEVEAHETVSDAVESLGALNIMPSLFVADLYSSADPAGDTDELAQWNQTVPVWIIAEHSMKNLEGRGFEKILCRPLDMGQLVREIKRRVGV